MNDLVSKADLEKNFSNSDLINWSYRLYEVTEVIDDTIPSYKINQFPERYTEALLKNTELTMEEHKDVMRKTNNFLNQIETALAIA